MSTLVHGVELDVEGRAVCLRFGMLVLLEHLNWNTSETESSAPDWVSRFRSPVFAHRREHFKQCFWKFDRAARRVTSCVDAVEPWLEQSYAGIQQAIEREKQGTSPETADGSESINQQTNSTVTPEMLDYFNASAELPLYFYLMLLYLRMQADAYAKLVPF